MSSSLSNRKPDIAILICCYNASQVIGRCLKHIIDQKIHQAIVELIVVDNNSQDDTSQIVRSTLENANPIFNLYWKLCLEKRQGKPFALVSGMNEVKSDFVILCDDDNFLAPDYLEKAIELISQKNNYGVIGGFGEAQLENKPPDWFYKYKASYAVGLNGGKEGEIDIVWGAASIINVNVWHWLFQNGFQLKSLGVGKKAFGEDGEYSLAMKIIGLKNISIPTLKYGHYIPSNRLTTDYILSLKIAAGQTYKNLLPYIILLREVSESNVVPRLNQHWELHIIKSFLNLLRYSVLCLFFTKLDDLLKREYYRAVFFGLLSTNGRKEIQLLRNANWFKKAYSSKGVLKKRISNGVAK